MFKLAFIIKIFSIYGKRRIIEKILKMRKERGVFVVDAYVSKKPSSGFSRPR